MFGELNLENANTEYFFEYGACPALASCANVQSTPDEVSSVYGKIGATLEATGLQPDTVYRYRLCAESENNAKTEKLVSIGPEGAFTTASAPIVNAQTGPASAVGATSAVVSGAVSPDGQPATYTFELGVYNGASTQYGIVFSGSAGASTVLVEESHVLTGLQPGTTYAYRITIHSGYGESVGAPLTFTTEGLPAVLAVPAPLGQLPIPNIAFPSQPKPPLIKCKRGYKRDKHGKCVKVKAKKKARRGKRVHL
jgi:hypothetical protein